MARLVGLNEVPADIRQRVAHFTEILAQGHLRTEYAGARDGSDVWVTHHGSHCLTRLRRAFQVEFRLRLDV